ncbi:MAG: hemerythrin domain-containing protein [Syntrophobacteraceae bacterium]|jgi:hemerythrin
MALIQWNDSLSVNVVDIDKQHQKLVGMINELNDAMRQGKGKDALGKIVNGLIIYAGTHFKTEETTSKVLTKDTGRFSMRKG